MDLLGGEVSLYEKSHLLARNLPSSGDLRLGASTDPPGAVRCFFRLKMHSKSTDLEGTGIDLLPSSSRHEWVSPRVWRRPRMCELKKWLKELTGSSSVRLQ